MPHYDPRYGAASVFAVPLYDPTPEEIEEKTPLQKNKLNLGDRVMLIRDENDFLKAGSLGTILMANSQAGVEWDDYTLGHGLRSGGIRPCLDGHGWWTDFEAITKYDPKNTRHIFKPCDCAIGCEKCNYSTFIDTIIYKDNDVNP